MLSGIYVPVLQDPLVVQHSPGPSVRKVHYRPDAAPFGPVVVDMVHLAPYHVLPDLGHLSHSTGRFVPLFGRSCLPSGCCVISISLLGPARCEGIGKEPFLCSARPSLGLNHLHLLRKQHEPVVRAGNNPFNTEPTVNLFTFQRLRPCLQSTSPLPATQNLTKRSASSVWSRTTSLRSSVRHGPPAVGTSPLESQSTHQCWDKTASTQ